MVKSYDHKKIEKKWQNEWEKKKIYYASSKTSKPKYYSLIEFPYPSGDGLHVGHPRPYIGMDIISRKKRMEGYNVLYPIGWDAFGLPTENYAIKTGLDPRVVTKKNSDNFRRQIKSIGISFDWAREINTTDPKYYKWTQWIFLQFFKKGLAYKAKININWCPSCKIGLANEEVVAGGCERCGTLVEKREKEQWMLAITKYADRLDKDLDTVDFLPHIKLAQKNWIGKSTGINIAYSIEGLEAKVTVFTTRPDTNFGATFVALAPDGAFVKDNLESFPNKKQVEGYIKEVNQKTDIERLTGGRKKTGVFTGLYALNGLNNKKMPMYVADFVLGGVGTGALVGVPGHDVRDFEFAEEMKLEVVRVVVGSDGDISEITKREQVQEEAGTMVNSDFLNGMDIHDATKKIMDYMEDFGMGQKTTTFKLRDWVFSRQRYWGEPIPVVHCEKCGIVPLPEKDLPLVLPKVKNYQPTDSGESPLANISKWVNIKCPKCKGKAKRETDTMPNWAGSSWYYLRYVDPKNAKAFADKKKLKYWTPVDWYNGGNEHTTLHLLYSRFWHKFLFDLKLVPTSEPYKKRTSHGIILAEGGEKMSKSRGNVINPDTIVGTFGADTLRLYEMFMGPFDQAIAWSEEAIIGPRRFLEKVWKIGVQIQKNPSGLLQAETGTFPVQDSFKSVSELKKNFLDGRFQPGVGGMSKNSSLTKLLHKTIKKVGEDIENMRFNTAISSMMILATEMDKAESVSKEDYKKFLQILAPFAPHMTDELWNILGEKKSINISAWPLFDESLIKDDEVKIAVQINGKVRTEIMIETSSSEEDVKRQVFANETVMKYIAGISPKKVIYIKGRLVNIVL